MNHDKFCRFANDNRQPKFKSGKCFDCERLRKAREEEREQVAQKIEAYINNEIGRAHV